MVIRKAHPHVDFTNGLVYMPYLSEWNPHTSSVLGVVHALVKAFEAKPPVYAKVSSTSPAVLDVEHRKLLKKMSKNLHLALVAMASRRSRDVILARDASHKLLQARQAQLRTADHVRLALEARLADLHRVADSFRSWLSLHPPARGGEEVDGDTRPRHALREQEVACRARDAALTDAMDAADEAIGRRMLGVEEYVRAVRWIAREQFFERLMLGRSRKRLAGLKEAAKKEAAKKEETEGRGEGRTERRERR